LQKSVCNAVGMLRPHSGKSAENHEIERALQDLSCHGLHLVTK